LQWEALNAASARAAREARMRNLAQAVLFLTVVGGVFALWMGL
jgi:hypothetical protein